MLSAWERLTPQTPILTMKPMYYDTFGAAPETDETNKWYRREGQEQVLMDVRN